MKLLVTGGAGFIGSNFIRHVLNAHSDCEVVNFDKLTYAGNLENLRDVEGSPRYTFMQGDIADRQAVARVFEEHKPTAVVNFAAESHVDRSILDAAPFVDTNIKGTQVLLEAARVHPVERFLQISTDEVYGSLGEEGAFTEDSPLAPNSPYAASKASADLLCRAYHHAYGVPVLITRSSNNYGPYQYPEKLIPLMIRNALKGEPLPVYGEGKQVRDWLHVEDNCRAIDLVLQNGDVGEIYNIGGDCQRQNIDVVSLICRLLKRVAKDRELQPKVQHIKDPRGAAHDFRYALDCSKIKDQLSWLPQLSFEEGLQRTVEWYYRERDQWVRRVITGEYQSYYASLYGEVAPKGEGRQSPTR